MSEGRRNCAKCKKEFFASELYYEWISGNPCDADYDYVCKDCKSPIHSNFTSDMIY